MVEGPLILSWVVWGICGVNGLRSIIIIITMDTFRIKLNSPLTGFFYNGIFCQQQQFFLELH